VQFVRVINAIADCYALQNYQLFSTEIEYCLNTASQFTASAINELQLIAILGYFIDDYIYSFTSSTS